MNNTKESMSWEEQFKKAEEQYKQEVQKPNILLVGRTGAGKSSIVNMIFGENTVDTGIGMPVTKDFVKVSRDDNNIVIYDSEGYELDEDEGEAFISKTLDFVKGKSSLIKDEVHLIWFVIPANSSRVLDFEIELFNLLKRTNVPIALVFSQCDESDEADLNAMIRRFFLNLTFEDASSSEDSPFFATTDKALLESEEGAIFRLESLVNWSITKLPSVLQESFISAQNVSLKSKRDKANSIILQHTSGNALVSFTPIPFSDAPILIASQIAMLTRIFNIFGITSNSLSSFMKNTGASIVVSNLGKATVGQLLKFIPIIGTAVGGLINATVASAITYAMGKAASLLIYNFLDSKLYGKIEIDSDFIDYFTANFNQTFEGFFNKKINA